MVGAAAGAFGARSSSRVSETLIDAVVTGGRFGIDFTWLGLTVNARLIRRIDSIAF
jgi:hypothetical protein